MKEGNGNKEEFVDDGVVSKKKKSKSKAKMKKKLASKFGNVNVDPTKMRVGADQSKKLMKRD